MLQAVIVAFVIATQGAPVVRNTWAAQYEKGSTDKFVATFEEPNRDIFRYRAAIVNLMQLKAGMTAAEVGAGSGFLARFMATKVGPTGRVIANELEPKMIEHMKAAAEKERLSNLTVVQGKPMATGFEPASVDAVAVVQTFSYFDHPAEMLKSINESLKPNGLLLVVDFPREGMPPAAPGMDAEEVIPMAEAAGFTRAGENGIVPGHYALIFRKKSS
jgi:ubiquinone/menaquinone biosynthesis C-methylase UbiE